MLDRASRFLAVPLAALLTALPARAAELVMLEEVGCPWCEEWTRVIGPIYPKTEEGRRAPLRRVDIHDPLPPDLDWLTTGNFTPTFILVEDGREIGRIRGYPGEHFFWGLLDEMMEKLDEASIDAPSEGS